MPLDTFPVSDSMSATDADDALSPQPKGLSVLSAMKKAGRALVAAARRARTRNILSATMMAGTALGFAQAVDAATVQVTITGMVAKNSIDTTGVFGLGAGTDLGNQNFTLVYTFDDTKGTQSVTGCETSSQCVSEIFGKDASSPGTATLQINGVAWKFGNLPNDTGSSTALLNEGSGGSYVYYNVTDSVLTTTTYINSNVLGFIVPATGTVLTTTASWESAFSNSDLLGKPTNTQILSFSIYELSTSGAPQSSGTLTPESIDVSGPMETLDAEKALGGCLCNAGDPITVGTGNLFEQVTDYKTAGQNPLAFIRSYNSMANTAYPDSFATALGTNWRSTFDRYLNVVSATEVMAERANGQVLTFTLKGGVWTSDSDIDVKLTQAGSTWTLTDHDDTVETYNVSGKKGTLDTITARNGYAQSLTYNSGQLETVTDSYGRKLGFTYKDGLLDTLTTPDGLTFTYGFAAAGKSNVLSSLTYSTMPETSLTYIYGDTSFPLSLTGIKDELGQRYTTWAYDSQNRAKSSQHGTGTGTDNLTTFTYNSDGTTTVTNAFGVKDTYTFTTLQGVPKVTQIDRASTSTTKAASRTFGYDGYGFLNSVSDWDGNTTTYTNNSHGDPTKVNEAVGTPVARTTTISYDPTWVHESHQIITPGLTRTFMYDGSGNPHTQTDLDTTTNTVPYSTKGETRLTTWTWTPTGQLHTVKLPRTDVNATTTFSYTGGTLTQIEDALGHLTKIIKSTPGGLPSEIIDPNKVETDIGYDLRLHLHTSTIDAKPVALTTTFGHDAANNLTSVQKPDNSKLTFDYDTAHRRYKTTDLFSNTITLSLDGLGDVTNTVVKSATATTETHSAKFDALGRILDDIGAAGQTTVYAHDPNGNVMRVTPPAPSGIVQFKYDALNRQYKEIDPSPSGTTTTGYDAHDRVTSVQDASSNTTTNIYNGFGDRTQTASPDSGTSVYHYDGDRNLTESAKPGPLTANMTYDALDRSKNTTYPSDATLNVTRTYDQTGHGFGVGHLTSATDQTGSLSLTYDERGNATKESRVVTGAGTLNTATGFDAASNVSSVTYPSGTHAVYDRDIMGRVTGITATSPGATTPINVATDVTYESFGPETGLTYGNGIKGLYGFDLDYRATSRADTGKAPVQNLGYGYYANNSVKTITDSVNPANSQTLSYYATDSLESAVSGKGGYGTYGWTWNPVGNVATQTINSLKTTFTVAPDSNKLASVEGATTEAVANTPAGNIHTLKIGAVTEETLNYNQANELGSAQTISSAATYKYDLEGQRLEKALPGSYPILYQFSPTGGELLSENDLHKGQTADYIYLNGRPIGEVDPTTGKLYYTHTDRLGTPQKLTDGTGVAVWAATYDPFGSTASFSGTLTTQSLRLPGQQFDAETGLNHNGFRDYAGSMTRYVQTDPIGLAGGTNTFQYARGNPIRFTDRNGLQAESFPEPLAPIQIPVPLAGRPPSPSSAGQPPSMINLPSLEDRELLPPEGEAANEYVQDPPTINANDMQFQLNWLRTTDPSAYIELRAACALQQASGKIAQQSVPNSNQATSCAASSPQGNGTRASRPDSITSPDGCTLLLLGNN